VAASDDESLWAEEEMMDIRRELMFEQERLLAELATFEEGFAVRIRESADGPGSDQASSVTESFELEQELSLFNNSRDMLEQVEYALNRIETGTYGACELCAKPIGKSRLRAFPRASLCLPCKESEERDTSFVHSNSTMEPTWTAPVENEPSRTSPKPATGSIPSQAAYAAPNLKARNGKGTAALVCGILGLVPFPITGFWLSLVAIILGWQGYKRTQRGEATNEGIALTGFVLGIVGMGIQSLLSLAIAFN